MRITIIGSGCPACETLYSKVRKLNEEGNLKAEVEYIKDVAKLVKRGIMGSPAILIDNRPVHVGNMNDEEILELVKKHSK